MHIRQCIMGHAIPLLKHSTIRLQPRQAGAYAFTTDDLLRLDTHARQRVPGGQYDDAAGVYAALRNGKGGESRMTLPIAG